MSASILKGSTTLLWGCGGAATEAQLSDTTSEGQREEEKDRWRKSDGNREKREKSVCVRERGRACVKGG